MNYKYVKKPVEVDAFQMTRERRDDRSEWPGWLLDAWNKPGTEVGSLQASVPSDLDANLYVLALEGLEKVSWDDFIIRGIRGELYPCKPDIFAASYDPVA